MGRSWTYCIAGLGVVLESDEVNVEAALPSFAPFAVPSAGSALFTMQISTGAEEACGPFREVGDFDTGNGHIKVERRDDTGAYRFLIRDIREIAVSQLNANSDFTECRCTLFCSDSTRTFALNNALMLAYAFGGAAHGAMLIHASCVRQGDTAYAFIAKSGTGKSTQSGNWLKCFDNCDLLNDDNPVVRVESDGIFIYGSPWSGKTPCYRNIRARLGALVRIDRAPSNWIEKQPPVAAFASVLPSCSTMKWDAQVYGALLKSITAVVEQVGTYTLHCLPDPDSARVCHAAVALS